MEVFTGFKKHIKWASVLFSFLPFSATFCRFKPVKPVKTGKWQKTLFAGKNAYTEYNPYFHDGMRNSPQKWQVSVECLNDTWLSFPTQIDKLSAPWSNVAQDSVTSRRHRRWLGISRYFLQGCILWWNLIQCESRKPRSDMSHDFTLASVWPAHINRVWGELVIVGFFKPGISFKALKYKGHVLCYTERLRLDFVAVSKSNETFFVLEITCLRYSRNVHLVLKCFKRKAMLKKSDYKNKT